MLAGVEIIKKVVNIEDNYPINRQQLCLLVSHNDLFHIIYEGNSGNKEIVVDGTKRH